MYRFKEILNHVKEKFIFLTFWLKKLIVKNIM